MKALLLMKCRQSIVILNNYGLPARRNDKKVTVVKIGAFKDIPLISSKGSSVYINYGNAVIKRRAAILEEAKHIMAIYLESRSKSWFKRIF